MEKRSLFGKLGRALGSFFLVGRNTDTVLVVKTVCAPDGRHRVRFFRREDDGVCGFREEYFDDKILEMNWLPIGNEPAKEYPDLDSAIAAAKAGIIWLHLVL